jgi:hypothetical protein
MAGTLKWNLTATRDPNTGDDATVDANGYAYGAGSLWQRTDTGDQFVCQDPTIGAARWVQTSSLDANYWLSGGARYPDGVIAVADGTQTALQYVAEKFFIPRQSLIDSIGIDITTAQTGAVGRFGVYVFNRLTTNLDLVKDAGEISLATGGGSNKFVNGLNLTLNPGLYFAVGILQTVSTMPTLKYISQAIAGQYSRAKGSFLSNPAKGLVSGGGQTYPANMPTTLLTSGSSGIVMNYHNGADCFVMSLAKG